MQHFDVRGHGKATRFTSRLAQVTSRLAQAVVYVAAALVPQAIMATDYVFTKIVDTTNSLPGSADPFASFSDVYFDGANVAFIGRGDSAAEGVYLWNGSQLTTVADTATAVPNGPGTFADFGSLSLDGGAVAFASEAAQVEGVYTTLGGALRPVADTTTIMPGSTVPFARFSLSTDVEIDGSRVAFTAFGTNGVSIFNEGAYLEDLGALSVVADRSDEIPGFGEDFIFFSEVDVDETGVVFDAGRGTGGGNGFYTTSGAAQGTFRTVYSADTSLPGLTQPNSVFSPNPVRLDGGDVAFKARGANDFEAIFVDRGGVVETVVSDTTTDPVTDTLFSSFFSYTLDNGEVAFVGNSSSGPRGIYLYSNGVLESVINNLAFLDGNDVSSVSLDPGGLKSGGLAFRANFANGTSAVYLATPEQTGELQMVDLTPTFDVQLTPGNVLTIEEGSPAISIDGGSGALFPAKEALIEFPLDGIPNGANIVTATLALDGSSSSGTVEIVVDGYAGDGLASTADATAPTTELAVSDPYSASSEIAIELDTDFIEAILGSASHLGLRLSSLNPGNFLSILSTESVSGLPPTLSIEFQIGDSISGDFDFDGDVDGFDFMKWQRGESPDTLSSGDLAAWEGGFGAPGNLAQGAATPAPEPATVWLLVLGAAMGRFAKRPTR